MVITFLTILIVGCDAGFSSKDRAELKSLRKEVAELRAELLTKKESPAVESAANVEGSGDMLMPINISPGLSPEMELKARMHRDSFPIAKNVISALLNDSSMIQPGRIDFVGDMSVEQRVSFLSRESRFDRAIVKIDFRSEPPSIMQVELHNTKTRTYTVAKLEKYKLVEAD